VVFLSGYCRVGGDTAQSLSKLLFARVRDLRARAVGTGLGAEGLGLGS